MRGFHDAPEETIFLVHDVSERGSIPGRGNDGYFSLSPPRPDQFWGPPSLLFSGYRGALFPEVKRAGRGTNDLRLHAVPPLPSASSWRGA